MSRKELKAQNDISIIIGNLPKRLQRKIAEDSAQQQQQQHLHNITNEDGDYESLPVEARRQRLDGIVTASGHVENSSNCNEDAAAIPGLLRIKADTVDASSSPPERSPVARGKSSQRHQCQKHQQQQQQPQQQQQDGLPLHFNHRSPIHNQNSAIAQPTWFTEVDAKFSDQLSQLHDKLVGMMQKNLILQCWDNFCTLHKQLRQILTHLLLNNLKFCCEQKVDTYFWKLLFYNIRDYLKKHQQQQQQQKSASSTTTATTTVSVNLLWLLNNGLEFYTHLHMQLCKKYLSAMMAQPRTHDSEHCQYTAHKLDLIAKVTAQKVLIFLGDLNRYKSKQLASNDYTEAFKCYQNAQTLIPTNGIPYNQLAIVAIQERKKFDAIYYHMRSLMSSNAIHSAKESLLGLFDEIRKKYEETEMKTSPLHTTNINLKSRNRTEVWVYPDGARRLHRSNLHAKQIVLPEENRLNEMPTDELLRRFISLYLYIIGKLYTGIGMETIQAHQQKLLTQFNALLKRNPLVFSRSKMLKMLALNIFVLYENIQKDYRREIQYQAFNFCNQILGLILIECNRLFTKYLDNELAMDKQNFDDLNTLLQYIKCYCEFLAHNVSIWEPLRSEEHAVIDCWTELRSLFQLIERTAPKSLDEQIITDEDIFFAGFSPIALTSAVCKRCKLLLQPSSETKQFKHRLAEISNFEKLFTDNCMLLETPDEIFILEEWQKTMRLAANNLPTVDDENYENIAINDINTDNAITSAKSSNLLGPDTQLSYLNNLKKQLEAKTNVKKMYNDKLEKILSYVDTKLYIEVRPKYLLLDTNCLIDCLEDFEQIVQQYKCYTLIIPFTVVKELDGLSKGVKLESYEKVLKKLIHHFDDVSGRAKKSLDFIKKTRNNVKCATTKGSIINASLFGLVEEEYVSNDDKILATGLALSKTMSTSKETNGKCVIQTELVLITSDRNLRVKALSRNMAVSELSEFMQWAKNCNT